MTLYQNNNGKSRAMILFCATILCWQVVIVRAHGDNAAEFAKTLAIRIVTVVADAAALHPVTLAEDRQKRQVMSKRQRELQVWFEAKDRHIGVHNCHSEQDRLNLAEFRETMAGYDILRLSLRRRQRFARELRTVLSEWDDSFPPALKALIDDIRDPAAARAFAEALSGPLSRHLNVRALFFGRGTSETNAFYLPASRTVIINLHAMHENIATFLDALEHEVWHHLLPIVTPDNIARNIWWEGFNEALSEIWAAHLYKQNPKLRKYQSISVAYPLQTAFATLFLGTDLSGTLLLLADNAPPPVPTPDKIADCATPPLGSLQKKLTDLLTGGYKLSREQQQTMEKMLAGWDWREKDGSPPCLTFLLRDGKLEPVELNRLYTHNPAYLMAVTDAYTALLLRELQANPQLTAIPANLRQNMTRVMKWTATPLEQFLHHVRD